MKRNTLYSLVILVAFCWVSSFSEVNASEDPSKESSGMPKLHIQPIHNPETTEVTGVYGGVSTQFSGGYTAGMGVYCPEKTFEVYGGVDKPSWDASAGYSGGRWTFGIGKKF